MVQRVRDYSEGLSKGLGIMVRCQPCGKTATYHASDFAGYIAPGAIIEGVRFRCTWCRERSTWVRWVVLTSITREGMSQWRPPPWMKRRFP